MTDLQILGKNLTYYRQLRGLSLKQVAEYLNVPEATYESFELNSRDLTLVHLIKLEDLLYVDMFDLLESDVSLHTEQFESVKLSEMELGDLKAIAEFHRIIMNYIKIKKIYDDSKNA
jgi:transcriptional regulator with XRE-family HTH domain